MRSTAMSWVLVAALAAVTATPAGGTADRDGMALFEGRVIDLREGWGEAEACLVTDTNELARCFRSEQELLSAIRTAEASTQSGLQEVAAASACSSSLRLYDGTNYTGTVLYPSTRTTWINLSSYGFSDKTSSFKVGACSVYLADLSNGGGDWYSTSATTAGKVAATMLSGWNNRISSVYIQ